VHGAGEVAYVFDTAVSEGAVADWVLVLPVDSWSAVGAAASGPDVRAQPAQASTTTGDRRAVRASGRGRERTAHFSWGTGRSESALRTGRQSHMTPCGVEAGTRSVLAR
jgi:hypothetical protein